MFSSVISSTFRTYLSRQQRSMQIGNTFIAESAKKQFLHILLRRQELPLTENGKLALGFFGRGNIHTSCFQYGSRNLFKKFASKSKKKMWYASPTFGPKQIPSASQAGPLQHTKPKQQDGTMRLKILDAVLFKAISDFLNSYEVGAEVYNLNVKITKVSLLPDFSHCHIYWKTSGTLNTDCEIQQVLDKCAPHLRHLLISHQVLGRVPPLLFLRDKRYAALMEVENLLKIADFGEENNSYLKDGGESAQLSKISEQLVSTKRAPLLRIDHEALDKQILEYKQRPQAPLHIDSVASITQKQLDVLIELRRQKRIEKQKKSRRPVDDDITPQAYQLARSHQEMDAEEHSEYDDEELHEQEVTERDDR